VKILGNLSRQWTIHDMKGDSTVRSVYYDNGIVKCVYEDDQSDNTFLIELNTDLFWSEAGSEIGSVHISIINLDQVLPIDSKSGIYFAPTKFNEQMKISREGYQLAFGKRQNDYPYFLSIRGYKKLLACPFRTMDDIKVTLID
jgi:hypothetical protein